MLRLQPVNDCSGAEASTALQISCVLAPAVIPVGSPTNLAFAMWTPTTRQQHTPMTDAEACSRRVTPVRPAGDSRCRSRRFTLKVPTTNAKEKMREQNLADYPYLEFSAERHATRKCSYRAKS